MTKRTYIVLTVTFEDRPDGGLNASSDDLPGLILSGADRDGIARAVAPAIRKLFEYRGFRDVRVHQGTPLTEVMTRTGARHVDMHVRHESRGVQKEQFVVEVGARAA